MSKWKPIETAPQDGTRILVWSTIYGGKVVVARYDDDRFSRKPRPYWRIDAAYAINDSRRNQPTHWMELPKPPGSEIE